MDQQSEAVVDNDESPSESTAASASEYLPSFTNDNKNENESLQTKSSSPSLPNNDFDQHSASDFIETLQDIETLREKDKNYYHKRFMDSWDKINSLVGKEVIVGKDEEQIKWKVVPGVFRDDLYFYLREHDIEQEKGNLHFVDDSATESLFGCLKYLWPGGLKTDLQALNECIRVLNMERKKRYQKPMRVVDESEFIVFHALLIAATQYTKKGKQLWPNGKLNTMQGFASMQHEVNFGRYMKEWRFREIRSIIPNLMRDESVKEVDDWWKFSTRVKKFNENRRTKVKKSCVLVMDESMSAFIPR